MISKWTILMDCESPSNITGTHVHTKYCFTSCFIRVNAAASAVNEANNRKCHIPVCAANLVRSVRCHCHRQVFIMTSREMAWWKDSTGRSLLSASHHIHSDSSASGRCSELMSLWAWDLCQDCQWGFMYMYQSLPAPPPPPKDIGINIARFWQPCGKSSPMCDNKVLEYK